MHRTASARHEFQLFAQMNTTPLIDVLLVLLIMFILTIPAQTHKVPIDLPGGRPIAARDMERHRLSIEADGALRWDGVPVAEAAGAGGGGRGGRGAGGGAPPRLRALAARSEAMLQLETAAEARYARFDAVLADVKRAGITRLGFVGNERYRW